MGLAGVSNLTYQETTTVKLWLTNPSCGWPNCTTAVHIWPYVDHN